MRFIYQRITDLIIQKLENNIVPWQKTWTTKFPENLISGFRYSGINILLLGLQDYDSHYWLSFKQCKDLGGSVKKEEKASLVVFWKPIVNISDNIADDTPEAKINFLLRYYFVFNLNQVNLPEKVLAKKNLKQSNPKIMEAESIISGYKNPPEIITNNIIQSPRYFPRLDKIEIQSINNFQSSDDYYASLFHEEIHSTGHFSRCSRKGIMSKIQFGTSEYSREELIAEIGASYLCNISGIRKTISNQISYIQNWLEVLQNDNRMILIAASQAQKACDYILGTTNSKGVIV